MNNLKRYRFVVDTKIVGEVVASDVPADVPEGALIECELISDAATHYIDGTFVYVVDPEKERAKIRLMRNTKLAACDWTQVADAPVDRAAWATYRQELRDFPNTCDVSNPVWPTVP